MKPLLTTILLFLAHHAFSAEPDFQSLFNGKDLTGWDGNPELWSVEDGEIVGKTKAPGQIDHNQFLIWKGGTVKNFELRASLKLTGDNNSGIQYRAQRLPTIGKWVVGGYQCDVHPHPPYNAMLYHERGRGIVAQNGQHIIADPDARKWSATKHDPIAVDTADWHEYSIIAKGNHIVHKLDGKITMEFHDFDEANRSLEGILAFQIHHGPAMEVRIKDIQLKVLPDSAPAPFSKETIPSTAQEILPSKPTKKEKSEAKVK